MPRKKQGRDPSILELITIYKQQWDRQFKKQGGSYGIAPKCHPTSPSKANFNGKINLDCSVCQAHMLELAVNVAADFDLVNCDQHPDEYGQVTVWYDGKNILIKCGVCGDLLHKLKPLDL